MQRETILPFPELSARSSDPFITSEGGHHEVAKGDTSPTTLSMTEAAGRTGASVFVPYPWVIRREHREPMARSAR